MSKPEYLIDPDLGPLLKLRNPSGTIEKELHLTEDGKLSIESSSVKVDGTNEIIVSLTDYTRPYVMNNSTSYGTMAYLLFEGTDAIGTPSSIKLLVWSKSSSKDYDIRIVRTDNGDVVAAITGQNNTEIAIKDLGSLSNLPTGATILEVQSKVDNGGECRLASISIKF